MRFVDSHLHLDGPGSAEALDLASSNDTLVLTCGVGRESSMAGVKLARSNPAVRAFVGVHPSEALKERGVGWVKKALETAAGSGEVGLDPKYSSVGPRGVQMSAYLTQLEFARKARKPVQVHSRGAETLCLDALASFGLDRVLMHWFQSEESLPRALDTGYTVSFGPSLIYSKKLQRMASRCDPGQVVTETDFPVGFEPLRGARGPSLVPSVVFKLAELWGMPFEDVRLATCDNAVRLLGAEKG